MHNILIYCLKISEDMEIVNLYDNVIEQEEVNPQCSNTELKNTGKFLSISLRFKLLRIPLRYKVFVV